MNIDDQYVKILQPDEFVKNFLTMNSFKKWCSKGNVVDLEELLKVFVNYELYEHCVVIKEVLDEKIN